MSKDNKGFSSLISLVSRVDSDDQFIKKTRNENTKQDNSLEGTETEPKINNEAHITPADTPRPSKRPSEKPKNSLLNSLVTLVLIIGGLIWWLGIDITGGISKQASPPNVTQDTLRSDKKIGPEKIYPYTQPPLGKNNILPIGEIKWCIREKSTIQEKRAYYKNKNVTKADRSKFNSSVKNYNNRCGEYRYRDNDHEVSISQNKNYSSSENKKSEIKELKDLKVESASIKEVQKSLSILGYKPGIADGKYGGKTRASIENFQRDQRLTINGNITNGLLDLLNREIDVKSKKVSQSENSTDKRPASGSTSKVDNQKKAVAEQLATKKAERISKEEREKSVAAQLAAKKAEYNRKWREENEKKIAAEKLAAKKAEYHRKWKEENEKKIAAKQLAAKKPENISKKEQDKVAADQLAAKKAEYHRKWREEQNKQKKSLPATKRENENIRIVDPQKRENLKMCLQYAGSPSLCKQHLLTQSQKTQVLNAQKSANLKMCLQHAGSPSLCKQHLLTQRQKPQVLNAQKSANLKMCLQHAGSPSLCKQNLLTQNQKTQVLNAQKSANLKTCIQHASLPSLCKQHLLTPNQKIQVLNAQKRVN